MHRVWCPYTEKDTNLGLLPFFHQYGCLIALTTFATGARLVILPKFTLPAMLQAIQKYKVSLDSVQSISLVW